MGPGRQCAIICRVKSARFWRALLFAWLLSPPANVVAADDPQAEIEEIKQLISELRTDYERRIGELEDRLAIAEAKAESRQPAPVERPSQSASVTAGNAFNPRISVVLDGNFYRDTVGGGGTQIQSDVSQPSQVFDGDEHQHADTTNGLNLSSVELAFDTTVDPYFDASAYFAIDSAGNVDVEEAWFTTRSLPAGLRLKAGRMLSDIGYLNNKHEHQWNFADQNLPYLNLLGEHGLQDNGLQLTWIPSAPFYINVGAELMQGNQERLGAIVEDEADRQAYGLSEPRNGPRMWSLFAKVSPDLGYSHSLRLGASLVRNSQHQEIWQDPLAPRGLEGPAGLWGLDAVYKYDNAAAYGFRDLSLHAEYLRSRKDLTVQSGPSSDIGSELALITDGMYFEGIYGIAPRWQAGARYDIVGMTNSATGAFSQSFEESDRWSAMLGWVPTEFSLFRLQYSYSDIVTMDGNRERFDTFWLQFLLSLGSHGAHSY